MEVSSALPALRRRAIVAVGLAALVCAAAPVQAQDPAPAAQAAPAQQDPLKFNHDGEMLLLWSIKPDRAEGFELAWRTIKTTIAANPNPEIKAFGDSFEILKLNAGPGGPATVYVFKINPTSKTYSYNHVAILFTMLKAPDPDPAAPPVPAGTPPPPGTFTYDQAKELFDKIDNSWTEAGITPWPLVKIG